MGLTIAEAFMLLVFVLLLLLLLWRWNTDKILEATRHLADPDSPEFQQQIDELERSVELFRQPDLSLIATELSRLSEEERQIIIDEISDAGPEILVRAKEDREADSIVRQFTDETLAMEEEQRSVLRDMAESGRLQQLLDHVTRSEPARSIASSLSRFSPEQERKLADLVRSESPGQALDESSAFMQLLESGASVSEIRDAITYIDAVERKLGVVERKLAEQARVGMELTDSINQELGAAVTDIGGKIGPHGRISFENRLGFVQGEDQIQVGFQDFLRQFCPAFLTTMHSYRDHIDEIRIEGHASSEWTMSTSDEQAFRLNLALSQRRARNIVQACLDYTGDHEIRDWARNRLVALGYSSSRPVLHDDLSEDREGSRRVEFGYVADTDRLLEDIRSAVGSEVTPADIDIRQYLPTENENFLSQ